MSKIRIKSWLVALMLLSICLCSAGTTGKLAGRVKDQYGKPIGYVNIVMSTNGKRITGTQSKENGGYMIINIPPGVYSVKYSLVGHAAQVVDGIRINVDQTTTNNMTLKKTAAVGLSPKITASDSQEVVMNGEGHKPPETMSVQPALIGGELHVRQGRITEPSYTIDALFKLKGRVKASQWKRVSNAVVKLWYNGNVVQSAVTDKHGSYTFEYTAPNSSKFSIAVSADGYKDKVIEHLQFKKTKLKVKDIILEKSGSNK